MDIQDMLSRVVTLPMQFKSSGNTTLPGLLEDIGYFALPDQVSEERIRNTILEKPECVELWLQWSEDKRVREGWYFLRRSDGTYVVGHQPEGSGVKRLESSDPIEACAAYIKREIEEIRMAR